MDQASYLDDWRDAEAIKSEFQGLANSLTRLGRKASKEDIINLMAWEIGDLRRAIAAGSCIDPDRTRKLEDPDRPFERRRH
jgi:hypothetical protein